MLNLREINNRETAKCNEGLTFLQSVYQKCISELGESKIEIAKIAENDRHKYIKEVESIIEIA